MSLRTEHMNPLQASMKVKYNRRLPFDPDEWQLANRYWYAGWSSLAYLHRLLYAEAKQ